MFRTKHVALWLLMFWFCHLFDLQNGIYVTTSSSLGVWVPVFMMSNSKRICSFSGGYTVFRFIPLHLWSMAAYPTSLTATPYHMPLILPLKYKPAAKSGKSTTNNCLSTWKTANPLYILTKTQIQIHGETILIRDRSYSKWHQCLHVTR